MKTKVLRGKLEPLGLVKVLAYIANLGETGYLKVRREDQEKTLIIRKGAIIFAKSNLMGDRLGDILLNQGKISQVQYEEASELLKDQGFRHGRSLVEIKAITPKQLWEAIEDQIRMIAYSMMPWSEGEFEFVQQVLKVKEKITLSLPIIDLVTDVVRHYDQREFFPQKYPDLKAVPHVVEVPSDQIKLDAHEKHVLDLIDGTTDLKSICDMTDFGLEEGCRIIFLLQVLGIIDVLSFEENPRKSARVEMIERYNEIFSYVHQMLFQQMGHVAHNLLKKYYHDVQSSLDAIFGNLDLNPDGTMDPEKLISNLNKAPMEESMLDGMLQEALEEYLYSAVLAIKRALGTEQETVAVQKIQAMQNQW